MAGYAKRNSPSEIKQFSTDKFIKSWSLQSERHLKAQKDDMAKIFQMITIISMCLCFFSLSQSMSSNIFDQSKEICLMLSIGIRKADLIRVFIYESLILVVTNALIGFCIGSSLGNLIIYLFCINVAFPFYPELPYRELRVVLVLSLFFAILSTYGSIKKVTSKIIQDRI